MYDNINNYNVMYTSTNRLLLVIVQRHNDMYSTNKASIDDIGEICTIQTTNLN